MAQLIVINICRGGFGLSEKMQKEYAEKKGIKLYERIYGETTLFSTDEEGKKVFNDMSIPRDCPILVEMVRNSNVVGYSYYDLKVVSIPSDVLWEIGEYKGYEVIVEWHRTWGCNLKDIEDEMAAQKRKERNDDTEDKRKMES